MTRVRGFTQDDAHIFCTPDQLAGEIRQCLGIVKTIFGTLGMTDYRVRLSMRDPESDKYVGSPENWDKAEQALREAAEWLGADYSEEAGEAAFYGPQDRLHRARRHRPRMAAGHRAGGLQPAGTL